ncbi:GDSL-type esterase/lipase family protein [Spirosoma soli]|uniref:GDSL-type esterase/lipase family protein n=1 Tax=Spirosoma soli TaxID=1770529 RepID=A0ABW5LZ09_9BACT
MIRVVTVVVWGMSVTIQAQTLPPFESEIRAFEATDKTTPPPRQPILFTGSSSIRLWDSLQGYFPDKVVLNRGFGGSELSDVIRYADRVIVRYQPKQVVLYAGENDIATGKQTGQQTYERFVTLFRYVRKKLPNVPFTFISIKPSPSRRAYFSEVKEANRLISQFLANQRNTSFVDIQPVMLQANGQPVGELFKPDSLHMKPEGYRRWAKVLRPYLK